MTPNALDPRQQEDPHTPVYVIGLGLPGDPLDPDGADSACSARLRPFLRDAEVLIGGKAQLAAFAAHPAEKLLVGADTGPLYERIAANRAAGKKQVALCGGDPLFFGLGARLAALLGPDAVRVVPGLSSLQGAAACLGLPWENARAVSLHGRDSMMPLAHALIVGGPVFVLTDANNTPATIAAWMLERGCASHAMHVLENLSIAPDGRIRAQRTLGLSLEEAAALPEPETGGAQRVVWLEPPDNPPSRPFGLNDTDFAQENRLLTKDPIRAAGLAALAIEPGNTIWDLGAGSGAVGIEAARLAWQGRVFAVEHKAARLELIRENRRRFGVPNLEIVQGRLPDCLPDDGADGAPSSSDPPGPPGDNGPALPCPHRVFIGGGLGGNRDDARQTLLRSWRALLPGGRLLAHCVLLSSLEIARATLLELDAKLSVTLLHAGTSTALANDMRLQALNPVFLVLGEKT